MPRYKNSSPREKHMLCVVKPEVQHGLNSSLVVAEPEDTISHVIYPKTTWRHFLTIFTRLSLLGWPKFYIRHLYDYMKETKKKWIKKIRSPRPMLGQSMVFNSF